MAIPSGGIAEDYTRAPARLHAAATSSILGRPPRHFFIHVDRRGGTNMKKRFCCVWVLAALLPLFAIASPPASHRAIRHGESLVGYGGCNDCHTPGWGEHGGRAPKALLLTGGGFNFQGPWGTTYPVNLRLYVQKMTIREWVKKMRTLKTRPPMPWWSFRYLSDRDLADMYAYIRSLGPAGTPAHDWVPPGQPAPPPYMKLVTPPPPRVVPSSH
jgi:mono/diheme cytochrome c family protein